MRKNDNMTESFLQVSLPEDTETYINIDHYEQKIMVYSNKAPIINRMVRKGFVPAKTNYLEGVPESFEWEFDMKDTAKLLRADIFKLNGSKVPPGDSTENESLDEE